MSGLEIWHKDEKDGSLICTVNLQPAFAKLYEA